MLYCYIIAVLLVILSDVVFAQNLTYRPSPCDSSIYYCPIVPDHTPIKRIRIVFHSLQRANGTENFSQIPEHIDHLKKIVWSINAKFIELDSMRLPTTSPYIRDSRIRIVWDTTDLYILKNDVTWNMDQNGSLSRRIMLADSLMKNYVINNVNIKHPDSAIHIFLGEGTQHPPYKSQGIASGIGTGNYMVMINTYHYFKEGGNFWLPGNTIRHELGHLMGLYHTVEHKPARPAYDYCDDTPTHPINQGLWEGGSNNLMDYNNKQSALTACQLGRIHYYLEGKVGNVYKAVIPDWKNYKLEQSIKIDTHQVVEWKAEKKLLGDLIIQQNAHLKLFCKLIMPPKAKIIMETGAKLTLEGGVITSLPNLQWEGILIQDAYNSSKDAVTITNGIIENFEFPIRYIDKF